jgi:hypothetical protein
MAPVARRREFPKDYAADAVVRALQARELCHYLIVDADRRVESVAAVHDMVADPFDCALGLTPCHPGKELVQKVLVCKLGAVVAEFLVGDGVTIRFSHHQPWGDSDLLDLSAKELGRLAPGLAGSKRKLETGRPGVEREDIAAHVHRIGLPSMRL